MMELYSIIAAAIVMFAAFAFYAFADAKADNDALNQDAGADWSAEHVNGGWHQ